MGTDQNVGDVIGMVSSDCYKIMDGFVYFHYLWSGPIEAILIIVLLIYLTGYSGLVGLGLLMIMLPLQFWMAAAMTKNRKKCNEATDHRVQV